MEKPNAHSPNRTPITIEGLEKKNVFSVPEGYFDALPTQIQARIAPRSHHRSPAWRWATGAVSLASLGLLLLVGWLDHTRQPTRSEIGLGQLSEQEIIHYLGESDVTPTELIETVSVLDLGANDLLPEPQEVPDEALWQELDTVVDPEEIEDFI